MAKKADLTNNNAVKALRWKEGYPFQFEIKDHCRAGFYLRVSKRGTKRWYYRYSKDKKSRAYPLGNYPGTTCAMAFAAYEDARQIVLNGGDPYLELKQQQEKEKQVQEEQKLTLSSLFHDHYYPRYSLPILRTSKNDRIYFETKIEPAIGSKPAVDVRPKDVEQLVMPIERAGHFTTARLTFATLRKIYNWASKSTSAVNPGDGPLLDVLNPCRHYNLGQAPLPPNRFFTGEEIRRVWNALGNGNTGRIAKLQLLTGCRVTEVAGMKWTEFDFVDSTWVLPVQRVKNKKIPLLVPLTPRMLNLIGIKEESELVFPAKTKMGHTTGTGVLQRIKKICENLKIERAGTHTMRKTFITHMARMGISLEIRNRMTNHTDSSVDFRSYNFHDYRIQKSEALQRWDEEISRILAG